MTKKQINVGLLKITENCYAQSMCLRGEIFFQRMSNFQDTPDKVRHDPNEGLEYLVQPDSGASIELTATDESGDKRTIQIPSSDFAEPATVFSDTNPFIACFYSFNEINLNDPNRQYVSSKAEEFGPSCATIYDTKKFFDMFAAWSRQNNASVSKGRVEYFDLKDYSGHIGPLTKDIEYKDEHEYRLLIYVDEKEAKRLRSITVQSFPEDESTLNIRIGSLEQISGVIPTKEVNSKVEFKRKG